MWRSLIVPIVGFDLVVNAASGSSPVVQRDVENAKECPTCHGSQRGDWTGSLSSKSVTTSGSVISSIITEPKTTVTTIATVSNYVASSCIECNPSATSEATAASNSSFASSLDGTSTSPGTSTVPTQGTVSQGTTANGSDGTSTSIQFSGISSSSNSNSPSGSGPLSFSDLTSATSSRSLTSDSQGSAQTSSSQAAESQSTASSETRQSESSTGAVVPTTTTPQTHSQSQSQPSEVSVGSGSTSTTPSNSLSTSQTTSTARTTASFSSTSVAISGSTSNSEGPSIPQTTTSSKNASTTETASSLDATSSISFTTSSSGSSSANSTTTTLTDSNSTETSSVASPLAPSDTDAATLEPSEIVETSTSSSFGSDTTLVTVIITTHTISRTSGQSSISISAATITPRPTVSQQTISCGYGVLPWCTSNVALPSSYGCLCPYCWMNPAICEDSKPTDTKYCSTLAWICRVTTDSSGSLVHSLPPGTEWSAASSTSQTLPWWDHISMLHATDDGAHTSDAHFNATLETSTKVGSDHRTTLLPYRAWKCVAGDVCYPPHFNFGCLFPNPLPCAGGIASILGIWPRPKIPFPPPIGPPELNYQLEPMTLTGDSNGNEPTQSGSASTSTSSSSSCSTGTYSTCSTACSMITILSQIYEEDCTSTCYTTSGCSDSNSATRSTNACTYSPYWNDPAIESSLSSLLAQFPFTFPEAVNITTTSTRTTGNILSSTSRSQSTSTSKSSSTFKSTGISTAKSSSTSKTTSSQASASKTSTELDVPPKATPTLLLAAKRKRCHNEGPEENYIPPFPYKRRDTVFCAADQTPKSGFGLFKWDAIDTEKLKQVCESLVNRKIVLKYEAFYLHSDRYGFDNGECYKRKGKGLADGNNLRVLFRVTKDKRGCSGEGTSDSCRLSDDPYCEKDFSFADYGVDKCVQNFQKLNKCKGNTWDDKSEYDTAGGTYYYDCVSWTVVAMNAVRTPPDTDDPLPEDP